jgi:hypothetical protein
MSHSPESVSSSSWIKLSHYVVVVLLVVGGIVYWATKPPTVNPMSDPLAAEAMALVQTHRALRAPTLRQAITDRVQILGARGQGVRLGEWTVAREGADTYLVRVWIREKVTAGWFEREYLWKVHVTKRIVIPLTVAASDLMPDEKRDGTSSGTGPRNSIDLASQLLLWN